MRKFVAITWIDSSHTEGWHPADDWATPMECISIGFVHKEDPEYIMLVMSYADNGNWANSVSIPRVAILRTFKLECPEKKKRKKKG